MQESAGICRRGGSGKYNCFTNSYRFLGFNILFYVLFMIFVDDDDEDAVVDDNNNDNNIYIIVFQFLIFY